MYEDYDKRDRDDDEGDDLDIRKERNGIHDIEKDRKMFSRKKTCWFCAKTAAPVWKDPSSYAWLVNEFGKISPGRVSGICAKHQRAATTAIKRGRNLGLIGYLSNQVAS